jgi:hypothetical protein
MNPEIVDEEFTSLVVYMNYKLLERNNQKLEAQWAKKHVEKMVDYIDRQMQDFDILHAIEVEERKWGWCPFYHMFTSIHALQHLAPIFPWAHNQVEAQAYKMMLCAT